MLWGKRHSDPMVDSLNSERMLRRRPSSNARPGKPLWSAKTLSDPSRLNVALLHPELSQAATLFLGLKMLLIAKAFSPDRVFADNKPDRRDQAARS